MGSAAHDRAGRGFRVIHGEHVRCCGDSAAPQSAADRTESLRHANKCGGGAVHGADTDVRRLSVLWLRAALHRRQYCDAYYPAGTGSRGAAGSSGGRRMARARRLGGDDADHAQSAYANPAQFAWRLGLTGAQPRQRTREGSGAAGSCAAPEAPQCLASMALNSLWISSSSRLLVTSDTATATTAQAMKPGTISYI